MSREDDNPCPLTDKPCERECLRVCRQRLHAKVMEAIRPGIAIIASNPSHQNDSWVKTQWMARTDPRTRDQLLSGDWDVVKWHPSGGRFIEEAAEIPATLWDDWKPNKDLA